MNYNAHIPVPIAQDINSSVTNAHQATMLAIFGAPASPPTVNCGTITNHRLHTLMTTDNVGPFTVTGLRPAVESLERIFAAVKAAKPDLYALLGTDGMECCRLVRGSQTNWSNHSFGTAIDMKIGGELAPLGSSHILQGLLDLYPFFHAERWFWGAGWGRDDSMHFECSDELLKEWHAKGII